MSLEKSRRATLYLMRHGRAAPDGVLAGQADYPLRPEGRADMAAWGDFFASIPISAVWSSPLRRAQDSAKIIISQLNRPPGALNLHIEPGFTELSLGEWEGWPTAELRLQYPVEWAARGRDFLNYAPPGGESFKILSRRVLQAFKALQRQFIQHEHVLIMAHQAVNRAILASLGQPCLENWLDIPQDYAALNELRLTQKISGPFNCKIIKLNAPAPSGLR